MAYLALSITRIIVLGWLLMSTLSLRLKAEKQDLFSGPLIVHSEGRQQL